MTKRRRNPSHRRSLKRSSSKLIESVASVFTWPWRKARATWRHWRLDRLASKSLDRLGKVFSSIASFEGTEYSEPLKSGEIKTRSWPNRKTLWNPIWWFKWTIQFFWRWFTTRPYVPMLGGLPAILLAAFLLTSMVSQSSNSAGKRSLSYRKLLDESMSDGNLLQARLAADALVRLNPDSNKVAYNRALIEARLGNLESARTLMSELATIEGSFPAAIWMAESISQPEDFQSLNKLEQDEYIQWLEIAVENNPGDLLSRRMLGDAFQKTGRLKDAYATYRQIADEDDDIAFTTMVLERQLGLLQQASARSGKLERVLRKNLEDNPRDFKLRSRYASMLYLLGREQDVESLLEEGLKITSDPKQKSMLKNSLAEVKAVQAEKLLAKDLSPRGLMQALELLRQGMGHDPNNARLLEVITFACTKAAQQDDEELTVLREAIVQGVNSDTAHFILGTIAINEGKEEEALHHLEIAAKSNPNLPGLLNNLAHAIKESENPDLERALRLSNAAINSMPQHPYLRETRGQILLKLERYTDAIADLEFALPIDQLRPGVRKSLAKAYDAIGQTDIAKRQRDLMNSGK